MFSKALMAILASFSYIPMLFSAVPAPSQEIKLQYSTGVPVEMVTIQSIDVDQLIPGLDFNAHGKQSITSWLTLDGGNAAKQISKPPFKLEWTLKILEVDITSNGNELIFDSRQPQNSLVSKELAKWVDRTLKLTINENLNLTRNSEELGALLRQYPSINELDPYTMLEGLLLPVFALADQELAKGKVITRSNLRGDFGMAFSTLTYEITDITDRYVVALFKGSIEPRVIPLKGVLGGSEKGSGLIQLSIAGEVKGSVTWDRANALICQITGDYDYRAQLGIASMEWPLTVKIKSTLQTVPASMMVSTPKSSSKG